MIINGGLIDASFGYDIPHAGAVETLFCEKMDGGLDDGVARVFSRAGHCLPIQTTV
jgi:hypothetical protein